MELKCRVQDYAWGKIGQNSQVAKFAAAACKDFNLEDNKPYAELWMGVHPNGPSIIAETGETLAEYISTHPECLGEKVKERFNGKLPFLFKVLSVNKALSIQAHPAKEHAETLHADRPHVYKDPNHKPEIAIALTDFEGLCGFRPLAEIQDFLVNIPELQNCIGDMACKELLAATEDNYEHALKAAFQALMECESSVLKVQLDTLADKLKTKEAEVDRLVDLYLRLVQEFTGDVGCFVIYFLNRVKLSPGQAMYLGPNVPHAYLAGDCIECMAIRDNVVRAGLAPQMIDTATLVNMLEYSCGPAVDRKFKGHVSGSCVEFNPPVPDFAVNQIQVDGKADCFTAPTLGSASIIIFTKGAGKYLASNQVTKEGGLTVVQPFATNDIKEGSVLFLPAGKILELFPEDCEEIVAYQAFSSE
jgi:mannose-6-phosphate isomerase